MRHSLEGVGGKHTKVKVRQETVSTRWGGGGGLLQKVSDEGVRAEPWRQPLFI